MLSTFDTRFSTLLKKLESAPSCSSAQEAFDVFKQLWLESNIEHESPEKTLEHVKSRKLVAEHGWQGIGTSLCFVNIAEAPDIRVYLHSDGSIVVQRMAPGNGTILFSKHGKLKAPRRVSDSVDL